jgi:hypothetical protein
MVSWEELFRATSPSQQAELLALARAQGVLYAHQLPAVTGNGPHPVANAPASAGIQVLSRLLVGKTDGLAPVRSAEIAIADGDLDAAQRDAVARALSTPDICLIQGLPGSGKSRVVTEILIQAGQRGERVLFLAPSAAALDGVLESVAEHSAVYALRCLGRDESAEALPAVVRAMTFAERERRLREESLPSARHDREQTERRCQAYGREETIWPQLLDFAESRQRLEDQLDELRRRHAAAPEEVRRDQEAIVAATRTAESSPAATVARGAEPFAAALAEAVRVHEAGKAERSATLARAQQQRAEAEQARDALTGRLEALRPLAEAKRRGRWWSPAWWRATFSGNVLGRLEEQEAEHARLQTAGDEAKRELHRLTEQGTAADEAFGAEQDRLGATEAGRRQAELADQEAALRHECELLEAKWQRLCTALAPEAPRPEAMAPAAVRTAQERWQACRIRDEAACDFAARWAIYLEESAGYLATRLPAHANVVAATLAALPADPHFGDASAVGLFDLLVLDEAEQVTESDLVKVARRARRWVLVGEPDGDGEPHPPRPAHRGRDEGRTPRQPPRAATFERLWNALHCDPSRLPYVWGKEQDRLCCRLRPVPPEQRQHLECERVADFPDIELRILSQPRSTPALAEVVFPPTMSIEEAKSYIYTELQELPVQAFGRSLSWVEHAERLVLRIGNCPEADARSVPLEHGVCELVASGPCHGAEAVAAPPLWHTCRLEFDRAAGWARERAEDWVHHHLRLRDLGRTARLDTPHRMTPPLAAVIAELLWDGAVSPSGAPHLGANGTGPSVEFVAVPPLERDRGRQGRARPEHGDAPRPALPRAGAGLELDLAGAVRHGDRLPTEFRSLLPRDGLVNYLEAQAVVRKVLELRADPALREAAARTPGRASVLAVMALYPAQVTLLREMLRRAGAPAGSLPVEVDLPSAFRQRECLAAVVSLTRSHSHRAVPLGETPQLLPLALTRARARLVLVGDPGTLARRGQWQGALDHLDERTAAREGRLVSRLLKYLTGHGAHASAFRASPGDGP